MHRLSSAARIAQRRNGRFCLALKPADPIPSGSILLGGASGGGLQYHEPPVALRLNNALAAALGELNTAENAVLWRLSEGAQADLVVFDLTEPRFGPVDDPIRSLVLNGDGRDVRRVVVAGRVVVEDGRLPGSDPEADRRRAQEHLERYRASYPGRDHLHRSEQELFPPTFRMVRHP